jgi:hypothetical protein
MFDMTMVEMQWFMIIVGGLLLAGLIFEDEIIEWSEKIEKKRKIKRNRQNVARKQKVKK